MKHKFPGTIFSLSVLGEFFDDNNILIDAVLNLSTFQSILSELLSYYSNYFWLWF